MAAVTAVATVAAVEVTGVTVVEARTTTVDQAGQSKRPPNL